LFANNYIAEFVIFFIKISSPNRETQEVMILEILYITFELFLEYTEFGTVAQNKKQIHWVIR